MEASSKNSSQPGGGKVGRYVVLIEIFARLSAPLRRLQPVSLDLALGPQMLDALPDNLAQVQCW
jgi:hypothetical protein